MKLKGPFSGRIRSRRSLSQCLLMTFVGGKQLSSNENEDQGPFPFRGHWGWPPKHSPALQLGTSQAEQTCTVWELQGRAGQTCRVSALEGRRPVRCVSREPCPERGQWGGLRFLASHRKCPQWRPLQLFWTPAAWYTCVWTLPAVCFSWCCGQIRDPSLSRAYALS